MRRTASHQAMVAEINRLVAARRADGDMLREFSKTQHALIARIQALEAAAGIQAPAEDARAAPSVDPPAAAHHMDGAGSAGSTSPALGEDDDYADIL